MIASPLMCSDKNQGDRCINLNYKGFYRDQGDKFAYSKGSSQDSQDDLPKLFQTLKYTMFRETLLRNLFTEFLVTRYLQTP